METLAETNRDWCSVAKAVTWEISRKDTTHTTKKEVSTVILTSEKIMKPEFNKVEDKNNKEKINKINLVIRKD